MWYKILNWLLIAGFAAWLYLYGRNLETTGLLSLLILYLSHNGLMTTLLARRLDRGNQQPR